MEKLQVPENITLRWELWRGVGKPELVAILTVTGLALIASAIFCIISPLESDTLISTFVVVLTLSASAAFFTKLENNQSIFDFLCRQARFQREQQTFRWRRGETEVYLFAQEKKEGP